MDTWGYDEMRRVLSPRLLEIAVDRSFRNDVLVVVRKGERVIGVAWRCCPGRRGLVLGGHADDGAAPVYYQPTPTGTSSLEDVIRALAHVAHDGENMLVVVPETPLPTTIGEAVTSFAADTRFARPNARLAEFAATGVAVLKALVNDEELTPR
jgi:hypothetical protein